MTKPKAPTVTFHYTLPPRTIKLSMPLIRTTLREVQAQLLSHEINGGGKKLEMDAVTAPTSCGMAACLGGWTSLFLLGFDTTHDNELEGAADELFSELVRVDRLHGSGKLHALFHDYQYTTDFDRPNVAATAIKRYLAGRSPWPYGEMPNIMPYTKAAKRTAKKKR